VLEVGCGTGLILGRVAGFARSARGIDLSAGMLAHARARGLAVAQASATELPIASASVDVAYSFKVLAHIPAIEAALREMARVVRPGGWVLAEFYNARSLRRLVKALKPPTPVSERTHDEHVYTRYDDAAAIRRYLPPELAWEATRGIRVLTPVAKVLEVPVLGPAVRWAEMRLADLPGARDVGGFLVACCRWR
jgi:SAM-dependent methyltransferase